MGAPWGIENPEQALVDELVAAVHGEPLPSRIYERGLGGNMVEHLTNASSINQFLIAWTIAYLKGHPPARGVLLEFFVASESCWMGDELLSTIYGLWGHLLPVAAIDAHAVSISDTEVAAASLRWMAFWFGVYEECTTSDGTVLTVGARSGGHYQVEPDLPVPEGVWICWICALAHGRDASRWLVAAKRLNIPMFKSPIYQLAMALRSNLEAACLARRPDYRMLTPLHIVRGADGKAVAVWLERSVNPNTPSLMAAFLDDGRPVYLPARGGAHDRHAADQAGCERDGNVLVYTSAIGGQERQEHPIPAGEEIVLGAPGATISNPDDHAPAPGPVAPVAPTPETQDEEKNLPWWRRLLRSLFG